MTETTPIAATYLIPASNFATLLEGIASLNKRCRKLGVSEIVVTSQVDHVRMRVTCDEKHVGWKPIGETLHGGAIDTGERQEWLTVEVIGQSPKVEGWTFVATLEPLPTDDGETLNLVSNLPGETCPAEFRRVIGRCDHCETFRRRKQTFVVRSGETYKCVGRQCLKDFLGFNADPHALASTAEVLASLRALCDEAEGEGSGGGTGEIGWSVVSFLTQVAATVRVRGWMSKGTAYKLDRMKLATANIVLDVLTPPWAGASADAKREWKDLCEELSPTDADRTTAEASVEWARDLQPREDEDYLANVNLIARHGMVTQKTIGLSASIVAAYLRAKDEELKRTQLAARKPSVHVGTVGKREQGPILVRCEKVIRREGQYGVTGIHKLTDTAGNDITWFASEGAEWLPEGEERYVSFTVTKHEAYNGRPQTVVNRVVIWTPEGVAAHEKKAAKKSKKVAAMVG